MSNVPDENSNHLTLTRQVTVSTKSTARRPLLQLPEKRSQVCTRTPNPLEHSSVATNVEEDTEGKSVQNANFIQRVEQFGEFVVERGETTEPARSLER